MQDKDIPEGFKLENQIIYGMRKSHPGLFEMKIHNPKKRNAIGLEPERKMTELINQCQEDEDVKVIMLHGGRFFSSGNDLSVFGGRDANGKRISFDKMLEYAEDGVMNVMVGMLLAMAKSVKPIVAVVRGKSLGIGFTLLSHAHFIYCAPEATFMTPFMKSAQSPEGTSTLLFPEQFGKRLANEILLTDKVVTAKEAVNCGFANGIVDKFDPNSDWFDPSIIPVIPKLIANDYRTLVNSMEQLNLSKDMAKIEEVSKREGRALIDTWLDPAFIAKMQAYMKQSGLAKKKKKLPEPKL